MPSQHNHFIGFKVYNAQRALAHSLEVALRPYGITPGQWNLLNQVERAGALSQKALAELTRKEPATITRYLDTLARKRLIVRAPDEHDRRAHVISLTEHARVLLKESEAAATAVADNLVSDISQKDIDTFLEVLDKLQTNADSFTTQKRAKDAASL